MYVNSKKILVSSKDVAKNQCFLIKDILCLYITSCESIEFDLIIKECDLNNFESLMKFLFWIIQNNIFVNKIIIYNKDKKLKNRYIDLKKTYEINDRITKTIYFNDDDFNSNIFSYDKVFIITNDSIKIKYPSLLKD